MNRLTNNLLLVIVALCLMFTMSHCKQMETKMVDDQVPMSEGKCCTYTSYAGQARIVRISRTAASIAQAKVMGGAGYEGYEVWFRFVPESAIVDDRIQTLLGRDHLLTLNNSWYVGSAYLEKYKIVAEKSFPCVMKVIKEGTGTPVVFEFETIDRKDYFESRK